MDKTTRRLKVLNGHLNKDVRVQCTASTLETSGHPAISVTPSACLVDEKVVIQLTGLEAQQVVTLVADVTENKKTFESRSLYKADDSGVIDTRTSPSIAGSYKGVDQMGLFWSIAAVEDPRIRFIKKNVSKPMNFKISAYLGDHTATKDSIGVPLITETSVQRGFMRRGVRRIPLRSGPVKGTIFIPDGEGPFPAIVDMYGALISLVETRAALLASHGYATLALAYLYADGLPKNTANVDFGYLMNAFEWFADQPYVDKTRFGAVGLCFGGFLSLAMASVIPQIKAAVNINGASMMPANADVSSTDSKSEWWINGNPENAYATDEGIVINEIFNGSNTTCVPAWRNGANILTIVGDDDKQSNPKWTRFFYDWCPPEYKHQLEIRHYDGAGHLIETPYMPYIRAVMSSAERMESVNFIPKKFHGMPMMTGGFPKEHAHAQEDSWKRILNFLHKHLKS